MWKAFLQSSKLKGTVFFLLAFWGICYFPSNPFFWQTILCGGYFLWLFSFVPLTSIPQRWRTVKIQRIFLGVMLASFVILYSTLSLIRFYQLSGSRVDLGTFVAIFESFALGGEPAFSAFGVHQFSVHVSPSLVLLYPVYRFFSFPETLLILQVVLQGLAVIPLFFWTRQKLPETNWPCILSLAYLLYPLHSNILLFDFHEISLFAFFFFSFLYFFEAQKKVYNLLFWLICLGIQETISLSLFFFASWLFWKNSQKKTAFLLSVLALLWFLWVFLWLMPQFGFALKGRYETFGSTPLQIIQNVLLHPSLWLQKILDWRTVQVLVLLLFPVCFLALRSTAGLVLVVPLSIHLFSSLPSQAVLRWHYSAFIIPFLFFATVEALRAGAMKSEKAKWVLFSSFFAHLLFTIPFHEPYFKNLPQVRYQPSAHFRFFSCSWKREEYEISDDWKVLLSIKSTLSPEQSIGIQNNLGSWFGDYPKTYAIGTPDCDFYLINPAVYEGYDGVSYENFLKSVNSAFFQQKYRLVFSDGRFFLYQKI